MKIVLVERFDFHDNFTLGNVYIKHENGETEYIGPSLEKGWKNNKVRESCAPEGVYDLKFEWSPAFKRKLWELYGVPNRSEIKFHVANYARQLEGCIAIGTKFEDIDKDGEMDITSSAKAIEKFHKAMGTGNKAKVIITDK